MTKIKSQRVAVVGAGIVGVPMAALLAEAGHRVVVIQRASPTSGWKVDAMNNGRSPIGGIEPDLDRIVAEGHAQHRLTASHDYSDLSEADAVLICVQTDKKGSSPDYGPLENAIKNTAESLKKRISRSCKSNQRETTFKCYLFELIICKCLHIISTIVLQ